MSDWTKSKRRKAAARISVPVPDILFLILLQCSEESSGIDNVADEFRERMRLELFSGGYVANGSRLEVDLDFIAVLDCLARFRRFQNRKADVDLVAVKNTRKRRRDDSAYAAGFDRNRSVLSGRSASEVISAYNDIAAFDFAAEFRINVHHAV